MFPATGGAEESVRLSEQERADVGIRAVWMAREAALHARAQDPAEAGRHEPEERRGVEGAQNGPGEERVERGAKAPGVEPAGARRPSARAGSSRSANSRSRDGRPARERREASRESREALGRARNLAVAGDSPRRVSELNGVDVGGHDLVPSGELHSRAAGRSDAEDAPSRREGAKLDGSVFVHPAEEDLARTASRVEPSPRPCGLENGCRYAQLSNSDPIVRGLRAGVNDGPTSAGPGPGVARAPVEAPTGRRNPFPGRVFPRSGARGRAVSGNDRNGSFTPLWTFGILAMRQEKRRMK